MLFGRLQPIPSNSDLNDYILPGSYYSESMAVAKTLVNNPYSEAGITLIVISAYTNGSICRQFVFGSPYTIFTRGKNNSTWGAWQKIDLVPVNS